MPHQLKASAKTSVLCISSVAVKHTACVQATITSEAMRARNWTSMPSNAPAPKKLKQLVRDGIPANLRLRLWLELSGGQLLKQKHAPCYFARLSARYGTGGVYSPFTHEGCPAVC